MLPAGEGLRSPARRSRCGSRLRSAMRALRGLPARFPGWVLKKQAAANLASTPSALRQRAARVGYVSPSCHAMPRRDQPKLCLNAAYFVLQAQARRSAAVRRRRVRQRGLFFS